MLVTNRNNFWGCVLSPPRPENINDLISALLSLRSPRNLHVITICSHWVLTPAIQENQYSYFITTNITRPLFYRYLNNNLKEREPFKLGSKPSTSNQFVNHFHICQCWPCDCTFKHYQVIRSYMHGYPLWIPHAKHLLYLPLFLIGFTLFFHIHCTSNALLPSKSAKCIVYNSPFRHDPCHFV